MRDVSPYLATGVVRIDRWLVASRMFKTRGLAQEACRAGHVTVNDVPARASSLVKAGDVVNAHSPRGRTIWKVLLVADKRLSAALAREMYEDRSPPPPPKDETFPRRDPGAGRPTKHDRRALAKLRGGFE